MDRGIGRLIWTAVCVVAIGAGAPSALYAAPGSPCCDSTPIAQDTVGQVIGLVFDSTQAEPLADARVGVVGTALTARTDSTGEFRFESVPAGEHVFTFFHPRLQELGVGPTPKRVQVAEGRLSEVLLTVPSRNTLLAGWCAAEGVMTGSAIGGVVRDEITDVPLSRARVTLSRGQTSLLGRRQQVEVLADEAGNYLFCGVPAEERLGLQAHFGNQDGPEIRLNADGESHQIRDLALAIAQPVTITGTIIDQATRAPIEGAVVAIEGTRFGAITDSLGRFGFGSVPPGPKVIRTEMIGYAERLDSLTVFSREALGLEIGLSSEAIALEPLVVTGRARDIELTTPGTRFDGLTETELERIMPRVFTMRDLLAAANMPSVQIREVPMASALGGTEMGLCVESTRRVGSRGGNTCAMVDVRLNDSPLPSASVGEFLLQMNPTDIKRMQFVPPLEATMLYGARGEFGVLLLYTR